jgi:hypothetical protein
MRIDYSIWGVLTLGAALVSAAAWAYLTPANPPNNSYGGDRVVIVLMGLAIGALQMQGVLAAAWNSRQQEKLRLMPGSLEIAFWITMEHD